MYFIWIYNRRRFVRLYAKMLKSLGGKKMDDFVFIYFSLCLSVFSYFSAWNIGYLYDQEIIEVKISIF